MTFFLNVTIGLLWGVAVAATIVAFFRVLRGDFLPHHLRDSFFQRHADPPFLPASYGSIELPSDVSKISVEPLSEKSLRDRGFVRRKSQSTREQNAETAESRLISTLPFTFEIPEVGTWQNTTTRLVGAIAIFLCGAVVLALSDALNTSPVLVPWLSGSLAFLVTMGLTPVVGWGARKGGYVAIPEDDKWHEHPAMLLGGVAIFVGAATILSLGGGRTAFPSAVWVGTGILFLTGLADDVWGLRPATKLVFQVGCAVLVVTSGLLFMPGAPLWVSSPLTLVWVLGMTNALNLLDAMDGVAASVAVLAAICFGVAAGLQGLGALATAAAVLAGATAGFLVYNVPPARILMGNCGSLVLGYLLAMLGLGVQAPSGTTSSIIVTILILAVPIFDTTFVSITRMSRGQPVSQGGFDHTMHRLVHLGWSERQVVLLMWGGGLLAGSIGLVGLVGPSPLFYGLALVAACTAVGIGILLAYRTPAKPVVRPPPKSVETTRSTSSDSTSGQAELESDKPASKNTRT